MIFLENWSITSKKGNPFRPPELNRPRLQGNVIGHPRFDNGTFIVTSPIIMLNRIVNGLEDYTIITTQNTEYRIGKANISPEYEAAFPNAYERLRLINE